MWDCTDSQEVGSEAATLERVRNSSLVEWSGADNVTGLSAAPKPGARAPREGGAGGRGAFRSAVKAHPRGGLERAEVRMPARVAYWPREPATPEAQGFLSQVDPLRVSRA
jgi:hypothetical protein